MTYESIEERAARVLPELQLLLKDLLQYAESQLGERMVSGDEAFALMSICYHVRLGEHAHAVLRLGVHPDSALVARSVLEGWWQLAWAANDPVSRAERCRAFAFVADWRLLRAKRDRGEPVDPAEEEQIQEGIATVGQVHLSAKALRAIAAGNAVPDDSYNQTWHAKQIRELADETGHQDDYLGLYSDLSDRHHWDMGDLVQSLHREGDRLFWKGTSHSSGVMSVATAFMCFCNATKLLSRHFALGLDEELGRRLEAFQHVSLA